MDWMNRLVVFAISITALCRLSASTPYEKYIKFLGAVLIGAQLAGGLLSLTESGGDLWLYIQKEERKLEEQLAIEPAWKFQDGAEEIRQQLWQQSEQYWEMQLQEETETEEEREKEKADCVEPVVIEIQSGEKRKEG